MQERKKDGCFVPLTRWITHAPEPTSTFSICRNHWTKSELLTFRLIIFSLSPNSHLVEPAWYSLHVLTATRSCRRHQQCRAAKTEDKNIAHPLPIDQAGDNSRCMLLRISFGCFLGASAFWAAMFFGFSFPDWSSRMRATDLKSTHADDRFSSAILSRKSEFLLQKMIENLKKRGIDSMTRFQSVFEFFYLVPL